MSRVSRTTLYCGFSTAMTVGVILRVFEARPNFYSAAMCLSQSSACLMILTNMFLVLTLMTGKALQSVFFGRLRAIEVDHLYERAWYAVTETCLAMTIFREEFDTSFFLFFTLLLSVKIFHWLAQDRIEYMEQTVQVARSFHVRMTSVMTLLLAIDCYLVSYAMEKILTRGPNVMIMFAFEFTLLAATILAVMGKYVLNVIESRQTETWDNKSGYVFYLELVSDFCKLVTYLAFFFTLVTFYGIPLHILRDLYVTLRSFTTKCRNFMRFRRATQDMDEKYHDATLAEIDATGDKTCIVCREEMSHASQPLPDGEPARTIFDKPKRLPCGHILHFRCLRSWLERQQTCPMCRRSVLDDAPASNARAGQADATPGRPEANNVQQQNVPQRHGTNHPIPASAATFQLPNAQGVDPVQLPRGFRLPPGWALLPVTDAANHTGPATSSSTTRTQSSPDTTVPTGTETASAAATIRPAFPPIIPLFATNTNNAHGTQAVAPPVLPPELTDAQIAAMEQSTRWTIEERLRILSQLQSRVAESFALLTRLQQVQLPIANHGDSPPTAATADFASASPVEESVSNSNSSQEQISQETADAEEEVEDTTSSPPSATEHESLPDIDDSTNA